MSKRVIKTVKPAEQLATDGLRKPIIFNSVDTVASTGLKIYDSCTQEYIDFSGTEIYKTKEVGPTNTGYFLYYEIDFTNMTGVGEQTGTIYHGGGVQKNKEVLVSVFSYTDTVYTDHGSFEVDSIFTQVKRVSRINYKADFTSDHGKISIRQHEIYKEVNGVVIISSGYPASVACKEF